MDKILASLFELLYAILSSVISGLCVAIMWKWFIVPLGVPAIGTAHAIGLTYLYAVAAGEKNPDRTTDFKKITYVILFDVIALLFAYVIHLAM